MDNITYVNILINTLMKKVKILEELIEITQLQESYITEEPFDMDKFNQTLPEKDTRIALLNQLDEGFEKVYTYVKEDLLNNKLQMKQGILNLKDLIKNVTDKSIKLQAIELKNKSSLEQIISTKKKEIRDFKMNSQTASNYYKNAVNHYDGQSYFLDKKK